IRLLADLEADPRILARDQVLLRVGDGGTRRDGPGGVVYSIVEEAQCPGEPRLRVASDGHLGRHRSLALRLGDSGEVGLGRIEGQVDWVELNQDVELCARGVDQRSLMHLTPAEAAGESCADLRVAEIKL